MSNFKNRPDLRIRQCLPVQGEWFALSHDQTTGSAWLERVFLWAQMEVPNNYNQVRGLGSWGNVICPEEEEHLDLTYVYGPDMAPFGMTWSEAYQQAEPALHSTREITRAIAPQWVI